MEQATTCSNVVGLLTRAGQEVAIFRIPIMDAQNFSVAPKFPRYAGFHPQILDFQIKIFLQHENFLTIF